MVRLRSAEPHKRSSSLLVSGSHLGRSCSRRSHVWSIGESADGLIMVQVREDSEVPLIDLMDNIRTIEVQ